MPISGGPAEAAYLELRREVSWMATIGRQEGLGLRGLPLRLG